MEARKRRNPGFPAFRLPLHAGYNLTMKLIRFDTPGPPSVLQCLDVPVPEPKAGEVLIRAHAIGVGIPDTLIRAGTYSHMPPLPATPGTELSGTIEKVGDGVASRRPG